MPNPSWENLDVFFQTDAQGGFATVVRLQRIAVASPGAGWEPLPAPPGWEPGEALTFERTLQGIFDDPYYNPQLGEYEVDSSQPRITCKEVDAAGIKRGDFAIVHGKTYNVMAGPQIDGTGTTVIALEIE